MPFVSSTATVTFEPQDLKSLKMSPYVHRKVKKDRRQRQRNAFNQVILKVPDVNAVVLVYRTGKCVILGSRNEQQLQSVVSWLETVLGPCKEPASVKNMVYVTDIVRKLDLNELDERISSASNGRPYGGYHPELSPALIFESADVPEAKVMIFRTGKVTVTGLGNVGAAVTVSRELGRFGINDPGPISW